MENAKVLEGTVRGFGGLRCAGRSGGLADNINSSIYSFYVETVQHALTPLCLFHSSNKQTNKLQSNEKEFPSEFWTVVQHLFAMTSPTLAVQYFT